MDAIQIALLGMGTVGTGVIKILAKNALSIEHKVGAPVVIKKILVRNPGKVRATATDAEIVTDIDEIVNDPDIKIVAEIMGGELPAKDYILAALNAGKHVVTANKDVVAKYGRELFAAAEKSHVDFLFEASVGGGIPIIRPLKQCLAANQISEIMGIVNGTTNYMLTKMTNEKMDYSDEIGRASCRERV
jgi:homoserine dehydrogenase